MQRIMVDLPEPDGPHTTTRSFCPTVIDTSRRTCMVPYHLLTLSRTIAGCASGAGTGSGLAARVWLMLPPLPPPAAAELALQASAVFRHGETEYEIDHREDEIDFRREALP